MKTFEISGYLTELYVEGLIVKLEKLYVFLKNCKFGEGKFMRRESRRIVFVDLASLKDHRGCSLVAG